MKFAVIGLGNFGTALVTELAEAGHEVLAIDTEPAALKPVQDLCALAAQANATDLDALTQLGVSDCEAAIIAIGEDFESSLIITAHCQTLGVRRLYTRVINNVHSRLLGLMKITGKIRAETLAASHFARQLTHEAVRRYFGIDDQHGIVEIEIPSQLEGQTLADADLRRRHGLNIVTIRRRIPAPESEPDAKPTYQIVGTPGPDFVMAPGDRLILFGRQKDIERLCQ